MKYTITLAVACSVSTVLMAQTDTLPDYRNAEVRKAAKGGWLHANGGITISHESDYVILQAVEKQYPEDFSQIVWGNDLGDRFRFYFDSSGGTSQDKEVMTLLSDGNVGIGTITPGARLDVSGGVRSSDGSDRIELKSVEAASYSEIIWGGDATDRFRFFFDHSDGASQDKEVMSLFSDGRINIDGSLGIGTNNPRDYKFAVNGKIRAKEIKVEAGWADYVFTADYDLPTLEEVEQHIKEKGHLINIPSAQDVEENGIYLGEMNKLLLEKIEELTLYTLQQQKELENQKKKNGDLEQRLQALEASVNP